MKTFITKFYQQALNKNSLIHGAWMAFYMSIAGSLLPVASSLSSGNMTLPTLVQFKAIIGVAIGTAVVYLIKNGINGTSSPSQTQNK